MKTGRYFGGGSLGGASTGNGVVSQIGGWIAYPFKNQIPLLELIAAVLVIAIIIWFLSDGTQWPEFTELPDVEV